METKDIADRLRVSDNTVRNYSRLFAAYLSDTGRGDRPGQRRFFDDHDLQVMATIKQYTDAGMTFAEIEGLLQNPDNRVTTIPLAPQTDPEAVRKNIELVTRQSADITILQNRIQELTADYTEAREERDKARQGEREAIERVITLEREIGELKRELGAAEGELTSLRKRRGWIW